MFSTTLFSLRAIILTALASGALVVAMAGPAAAQAGSSPAKKSTPAQEPSREAVVREYEAAKKDYDALLAAKAVTGDKGEVKDLKFQAPSGQTDAREIDRRYRAAYQAYLKALQNN